MFQRWGFLMGEMWGLLLLAALLGLFAGWLIWGRQSSVSQSSVSVNTGEADALRASLDACNSKGRDQTSRIAVLEGDLGKARAQVRDAEAAAEAARATAAAEVRAAKAALAAPAVAMAAPLMSAVTSAPPMAKAETKAAPKASTVAAPAAPLMSSVTAPKAKAPAVAAPKPVAKAASKATAPAATATKAKADAKPMVESAAATKAQTKPQGLDKARGGKADDLKMVKGIGPKLEILCHKLGYFHFDQIAAWTAKEVAWVDDNLEGFKGRVTRDEWVKQAKILAKGGTTEFANRVKDGGVY